MERDARRMPPMCSRPCAPPFKAQQWALGAAIVLGPLCCSMRLRRCSGSSAAARLCAAGAVGSGSVGAASVQAAEQVQPPGPGQHCRQAQVVRCACRCREGERLVGVVHGVEVERMPCMHRMWCRMRHLGLEGPAHAAAVLHAVPHAYATPARCGPCTCWTGGASDLAACHAPAPWSTGR